MKKIKILFILCLMSINLLAGKSEYGNWYAWKNDNYEECETYKCYGYIKGIELELIGIKPIERGIELKYDNFKIIDINNNIYTNENWPTENGENPTIILTGENLDYLFEVNLKEENYNNYKKWDENKWNEDYDVYSENQYFKIEKQKIGLIRGTELEDFIMSSEDGEIIQIHYSQANNRQVNMKVWD